MSSNSSHSSHGAVTTALKDLMRRWQWEARHWQDRADEAGRSRLFAAAYEYMTKAEQYASCAEQLLLMPSSSSDLFAREGREWLIRCLKLVRAMAEEGICIDGHEDPQDVMTELCGQLGLEESDDPWAEAMQAFAEEIMR